MRALILSILLVCTIALGSSWLLVNGGSGPPFTPGSLSGLVLWLDADNSGSITQSGGFVSQWDDQSATAATFTQATGNLQPAYVASAIGGKPAISFTGASSGKGLLVDTGSNTFIGDGTTPFTIWCVVNGGDATSFVGVVEFHAAAANNGVEFAFARAGTANYANLYFSGGGSTTFGHAKSNTAFDDSAGADAVTITYDGSGTFLFYASNVSQTVTSSGSAGNNFAHTIIGAADTSGVDPILYMSECAVYSRVLNSTELGQLQTYGNAKYGL